MGNVTSIPRRDTTYTVTSAENSRSSIHSLTKECIRGNFVAVKALLDRGENLETHYARSLAAACLRGHKSIVELLINTGVDVNVQNDEGWSALMVASQNGHYLIVCLLVESGAQVNMKNYYGTSSLMLGCQEGHRDIVEYLLKKGATVNSPNNNGVTCLMSACKNKHEYIVRLLIQKGAEINTISRTGDTALMNACQSGNSRIVQLLIDNNADIHIQKNGVSAFEIAREKKREHKEVELILMKGIRFSPEIATANEIAEDVGMNPRLLDQSFSENVLSRVAGLIPNWLEYADYLRLTPQEINGINTDPQLSFRLKSQELLKVWYRKSAHTEWAHYRVLVETSCELGFANVAGEICKIIKENSTLPDDNPTLTSISKECRLFNDQCLGGGAYSTVYKGEINGKPCALKVLYGLSFESFAHLPQTGGETIKERFRQECEYLKSFKHPNIVEHLATKTHPKNGHFVVVLELLECNLRHYFSATHQREIGLSVKKSMCLDIISALEYIHKRHIAHQDLCGDNVLLANHTSDVPIVKVCDCGMSKLVSGNSIMSSILPAFGHRGYLPPEAFDMDASLFNSSFDMFQFGVLVLQIVQCVSIIRSPLDRFKVLQKVDSTHSFKQIIEQCLLEDPSARPTAMEVQRQLTAI